MQVLDIALAQVLAGHRVQNLVLPKPKSTELATFDRADRTS